MKNDPSLSMTNRSVPRAEWDRFFRDFNRDHHDVPVDLTVVGNDLGVQMEARGVPFDGIVANRVGTSISIVLGGPRGAYLDHPVRQPIRVWVAMDDRGNERALEIESATGVQTILELANSGSS